MSQVIGVILLCMLRACCCLPECEGDDGQKPRTSVLLV